MKRQVIGKIMEYLYRQIMKRPPGYEYLICFKTVCENLFLILGFFEKNFFKMRSENRKIDVNAHDIVDSVAFTY